MKNSSFNKKYLNLPQGVRQALMGINYMHKKLKKSEQEQLVLLFLILNTLDVIKKIYMIYLKEIDDWKYAAMVIDRLLLYVKSP